MRKITAFVATLAMATMACPGFSQANADAMQLLEQSTNFTKGLKTFYIDMSTTVSQGGQTMGVPMKIWAEMPDKMMMRMEGPSPTATYMVGTRMTSYISQMNQYMTMDLPASPMKEMLTNGFTGMSGIGGAAAKPKEAKIVGQEVKNGTKTNHVKMTMPDGSEADLWIAEGAQPLPVFATMKMPQQQINTEAAMKWVVNQPIPAATFQFTPPPGATEMKVPANQIPGAGAAPAGAGAPAKR